MNAETFTECEADQELSWDCFLLKTIITIIFYQGPWKSLVKMEGNGLIQMNKTIDHRLLMVHENEILVAKRNSAHWPGIEPRPPAWQPRITSASSHWWILRLITKLQTSKTELI